MKRLSFLALPALLFSTSALAEVDPKIHKLCIEAKDYEGCVRSMRESTESKGRQGNSQSTGIAVGNSCKTGFAYIGEGYCQQVDCAYSSGVINRIGHDTLLAGLKDNKGNDVWSCKYKILAGAGALKLTGGLHKTTQNNLCPPGEPQRGFNSTCQTATEGEPSIIELEDEKSLLQSSCDFKLQKYNCSYKAYLYANPGIKEWAISNPDMAAKERLRLQSVD